MMQPIVFKVKLLRGADDLVRSEKGLLWLLEALCKINEGHLEQFPYPPLYESGIRYQRENGTEEWLDIPTIIEAGWGDCEDLACWRVAELRRQGKTVGPYIRFREIGGVYHFHALVMHYRPVMKREGGKLVRHFEEAGTEDPSQKLGMGWEEEFARLHAGKPGKAQS
jgi:hypothetical protein